MWATLGSLDHAVGPEGPYRVAMVPSVASLVAAVALGGVGLLAVVALLRLAGRSEAHALDIVRPAAAGGLLVLPFLPWLADLLPALVLLSGPGAWLWWGLIAGQACVAAALAARATPTPPTADLPPSAAAAQRRRWTTGILLASALASGMLADRFIRTPLFPGGDEPHYLVIAQSLWRDGDLRIENNHHRRDYDEYFHRDLAPHYLTRGVDREIYSIHPIGMPVLMTPVYAAGGYELVVAAFVLLGAIALTIGWRLAWAVTGSAGASTFGWAVLAFGVPWVFNTFAVYPEIPAAAATLAAFSLTAGWRPGHTPSRPAHLHVARFVGAGLALGALPWFSTKYAVMAGALGLVVLARLWLPVPSPDLRRAALARTFALGLPCAVSLAGWFTFFRTIWGTWSPAAPYGSQRETRIDYLPQGGPGLLFDQEYGIVLFAPALLMVLPGLLALWRQGRGPRRVAIELTAVWGGLLAVVGAFHIWWGGSAIVGRPVIAALPLLVLPVAAQWRATASSPQRRAAQWMLLWVGLGITVVVAAAQQGLLLVAGRDGSSQVLEYLSPSSGVWTWLPTFLRQSPADAAVLTMVWVVPLLAIVTGLAVLDRRRRAGATPGRLFGEAAAVSATLVVVLVAGLSGLVAATVTPSTPPPDLGERARVRLLDEFDAERRPIAIRYTPMSIVDPTTVPPLFPIIVNARGASDVDRQTQLFGKRLSLPAGRYAVDVVFDARDVGPVTGALAVQVGRTGPPHRSWDLDLRPPATWGRAFDLPVDVGFVGFKATPAVVAAGPRIQLTPQAIVDAGARPSTRGVLGSGRYGDIEVFVHGEDAWPERDGLWVRGRTTAEMTLVGPAGRPLTIDVRAGARQVDVVLELGGEVRRATLSPGMTSTVEFPAGDHARPLRVSTSAGFVPAEVEEGSRDRRLLGCWLTLR